MHYLILDLKKKKASKGAVIGMTLPMARDLAPFGIRVMKIVRKAKIIIDDKLGNK